MPAITMAAMEEMPDGDIASPETSASYPNSAWRSFGRAMLAQYITANAQKKMMQHTAKLRSPRQRKSMIGLLVRISRKISKTNPTTNSSKSVCSRPNGSASQSHSRPLLSMISQEHMTSTSNDSPM